MKKLTDILTEDEYSQLSLAYLHGLEKELEFWKKFWWEHNIHNMSLDDIMDKYCDRNMSLMAFLAFNYRISPYYTAYDCYDDFLNYKKYNHIVKILRLWHRSPCGTDDKGDRVEANIMIDDKEITATL